MLHDLYVAYRRWKVVLQSCYPKVTPARRAVQSKVVPVQITPGQSIDIHRPGRPTVRISENLVDLLLHYPTLAAPHATVCCSSFLHPHDPIAVCMYKVKS
jgi:hypothetical protein